MAILNDRIKEQRLKAELTLAEVAARLGVQEATVQRYESGEIKNIKHDTISALANIFRCSPAYLMGWEDSSTPLPPNIMPMPKFNKRIPILGTIACGQPILAVQEDTEYIDIDELIDADFALYCRGDSMIDAHISDGDIVCIREQPKVERGEIAAVIIEDSCEAEATLKQVFIMEDRLILRAKNPLYDDTVYHKEEMNKVRILGKATHFISKVRHK